MSKKQPAKIGEIRYTDIQKEIIAQGVETEFFRIISRVIRPKRVTKIAMTLLSAGASEQDLWYQKGKANEAEWLIKELVRVAEDYNKKQLDADTEGVEVE